MQWRQWNWFLSTWDLMFICDMVFYLMPAAFTALQTGQNLTLDGLDPRISFILT